MIQSVRPFRRLPRAIAAGAVLLACCLSHPVHSAEPPASAAILQDLRSFREMATVLYVAAHPDDENTQLIAYLARGRNYRMAYLSVTRGDGGQNVLGPEFGPELGVARTQELLAARRLDGGRQFFTRAIDFGFSKNAEETLNIWDRQQVVSDIVRVYRTFRPDVVVAGFSPTSSGSTHGHHTSSAILALEAFKLSGNPKAFPEQLADLSVWQPKRIVMNNRGGSSNAVPMEMEGDDLVTGMSLADLAGRSRAMHKTQGFDNPSGRAGGGGGRRTASFQNLDGEPATKDLLDGIDTTWSRVPGGAEIGTLADQLIQNFNLQDPVASVPALLALRTKLSALARTDAAGKDPIVNEKRALLDRILQHCVGLEVETTVPQAEVVPGETLKLHHAVTVHSSVPVRWLAVRYPATRGETNCTTALQPEQAASRDIAQTLSANTPLTQPYWLREEGTPGMFRVDDPKLIGTPESPSAFPIEYVFEVEGQKFVVPDEPAQVTSDSVHGKARRRMDVIPPVSLKFVSEVGLFAPGSSHPVEVEMTAFRANSSGRLKLDAPAGWKSIPASQPFSLAQSGDHARFKFTITAPSQPASAKIIADAEIGGAHHRSQRTEVRYAHIPVQLLEPPARLNAVALDLAVRGQSVGYLPGAGDSVAEDIGQMGYQVTILGDADLTPERLHAFDAVVIGVRAFNVRNTLASLAPALFTYAENGGTVVVQYNRPDDKLKVAPYDLHVSGDRVTDENAEMSFLAPDHPALNTPNKITPADFIGWVQERGIYFPNQWDAHFTAILACHDAGEAPLKGSLLVAQHGKGYFVYTGLAFFRQLPAGVPGAYRLFANLVSLGRTGAEKIESAK